MVYRRPNFLPSLQSNEECKNPLKSLLRVCQLSRLMEDFSLSPGCLTSAFQVFLGYQGFKPNSIMLVMTKMRRNCRARRSSHKLETRFSHPFFIFRAETGCGNGKLENGNISFIGNDEVTVGTGMNGPRGEFSFSQLRGDSRYGEFN